MTDPRRPRVLHVYGAEFSVRTLLLPQLRFLADSGFDVRVACRPDSADFDPILSPFAPIAVPFPRDFEAAAMLNAGRRFVHVVREVRPDLVHLHSSVVAGVVRLTPRTAWGCRPAVAFTVHGFPFLWEDLGGLRPRVLEGAERLLARKCDVMLFQSAEDLEGARRRHYRTELAYLGNGVPSDWFSLDEPRPRAGLLRLLFTGRLVEAKGILVLLEALRTVPDVHLVVAGGRLTSERDDILERVAEMSDHPAVRGRVELLGWVPPEALPGLMDGVDAFVLPSFHEGVPRSVLEAMAAARPVVATSVRGPREIITDGTDGFLVPPRDTVALANALNHLAGLSLVERSRVGLAGRRKASSHYREADVFARLLSAYRKLGVAPQ